MLHTNLVELMGQEAADSLMDELPPGGWQHLATKEDVAATEQRLQASFSVAMAETNARITEINAELRSAMEAGFSELRVAIATGLAESAKERAEIVKAQARQLYVIVATIAAATISIWIALFTGSLWRVAGQPACRDGRSPSWEHSGGLCGLLARTASDLLRSRPR